MPIESANAAANREHLSALVDGELEADHVARACASWRDEPESRSTWHAYHLIGDVLRSEDLASHAARDSAFVLALRERLAAEPVVLAPMPVPVPAERRRPWFAPAAAAAAGFAAVAVVVVVMRSNDGAVAVATGGASVPVPVRAAEPALAPTLAVAERETTITGPMIRDVRLDRYLAAHQQFVGSSALGAQGFLRSATADGTGR